MAIKKLKFKKVLITGGAGFIGSHLVDKLIEIGSKVVIVDNLSSGKKENVNKKAKFYKLDVRSQKLKDILKVENIEIIFHLAAQPIVETAYKNPLETIDTNVMGTANLLEACRLDGKQKAIVVASSDKAYGESEELPYKENTSLRADHPYNASKAMADLLAQTYARTYGLPITITRFSNVFGPRDENFNRIIPGIFEAVIKNKPLLIRSDGKMIREYTYVVDIVDGCLKLATNSKKFSGEAFNFGSKNIFSVIGVIKKIGKILNAGVNYKILDIAKNEIPRQYLDWSRARKELKWSPETSFSKGIKWSFKWYQNYFLK